MSEKKDFIKKRLVHSETLLTIFNVIENYVRCVSISRRIFTYLHPPFQKKKCVRPKMMYHTKLWMSI